MIGLGQDEAGGKERAELILASGSPRRFDLLRREGLSFQVVVPQVEEEKGEPGKGREVCAYNAAIKADEVAKKHPGQFIIAADTVVVLGGDVLGKPADLAEARSHLGRLRGRVHEVMTGVSMRGAGKRADFVEVTYVKFKNFTDGVLEQYLIDVEVLDKAGAYAFQNDGRRLVEKVEGDEDNVIGLPRDIGAGESAPDGFSFARRSWLMRSPKSLSS